MHPTLAASIYFIAALLFLCLCAAVILLAVRLSKSQKFIQDQLCLDPVTGGGNSAWFRMEAENLLRQSPDGYYTMIILDIDHFNVLNEAFGHAAGDAVLAHFYRTICGCLDSNERVVRISSDNYGLLVKSAEESMLIQRLYDIVTLLNDFNYQREQKYFFLVTLGICIIGSHEMDALRAEDYARSACRKARSQSGSGLFRYAYFKEEDREKMIREKALENRIENALTNHDLLVYLQPKYDLSSNMVAGAEALVRWNDPQSGLIPPSEFIYLFERNGFITALDLYVFREVCSLLRRWLDSGRQPIRISVNLSRVHLNYPDFLDRFESIRQEYRIPAKFLEFELTESIVHENMLLLQQVFGRMHALGYRCALDDFGSGYSSLNILKTVPTDVIKLDGAFFVEDTQTKYRGQLIVESVIELGRKLGIETVAEGVRTPEQAEYLRQAHCDMAQAFLFAKPMPIPDFEALLPMTSIDNSTYPAP